jgi:hypothetical protein
MSAYLPVVLRGERRKVAGAQTRPYVVSDPTGGITTNDGTDSRLLAHRLGLLLWERRLVDRRHAEVR